MTLRSKAQHYFLVIVISAASTIIVTRIFLEITSYPQISGLGLHIAHVLWGGVALLIATYLAVLYKGRNVLNFVSILAGIGWGLFIDEVGKFITANNDYFYKPAAPIIYITFLLNLLYFFYIQKKSKTSSNTRLNDILELIEINPAKKISETEYKNLTTQLNQVIKNSKIKNEVSLAKELLKITEENGFESKPNIFNLIELKANIFADKIIKHVNFLKILFGFLALRAISSIVQTLLLLLITVFPSLTKYELWQVKELNGLLPTELVLFYSRNILSFVIATVLIYSVFSKNKKRLDYVQLALLLNVAVVDIFSFYFDQFSTAIFTIIDIGLILLIERYQTRK